jgi:hypothetical protein
MTRSPCWRVFAVALIGFVSPSIAGPSYGIRLIDHAPSLKRYPARERAPSDDGFVAPPDDREIFARPIILVSNETEPQPDTDVFALMSGKCSTLIIAGRDFACRSVAFFHREQGRTDFTIALDDPTDDSHIVSFSGEGGRRGPNNLYELPIDRMLLNSQERPKVDGLPVPFAEASAGICTQLGNFAAGQVSSISCTATDKNGKTYELQFESDGLPITVRRVRLSPPTIGQHPIAGPSSTQKLVDPDAVAPEYREAAEQRRAEQIGQLECRYKANIAQVLPRDRTAYIIECLTERSQKPATTANR